MNRGITTKGLARRDSKKLDGQQPLRHHPQVDRHKPAEVVDAFFGPTLSPVHANVARWATRVMCDDA